MFYLNKSRGYTVPELYLASITDLFSLFFMLVYLLGVTIAEPMTFAYLIGVTIAEPPTFAYFSTDSCYFQYVYYATDSF